MDDLGEESTSLIKSRVRYGRQGGAVAKQAVFSVTASSPVTSTPHGPLTAACGPWTASLAERL